MNVEGHGRRRRARIFVGCAAFLMWFGVIGAFPLPAYSVDKGTVPCFSVVTLEQGQDLNALAKKYHATAQQIIKDNPHVHVIKPGVTLTIQEDTVAPEVSRSVTAAWYWPVLGPVSSDYGWRGYKEFHHGIDIAVPSGTDVKAARAGQVMKAGWLGVYGLTVLVDHGNGIQTLYGHNQRLLVKAGDYVESGETIAISGNTGKTTGPHLHFEIRLNGKTVNPVQYLPQYAVAE